jgi:hypothetical protein
MTEEERMEARLKMLEVMAKITKLGAEDMDEFVRGVTLLGSCILEPQNHGMLIVVENEDTIRVLGINATSQEAAYITATAANTFIENLEANDMHRKGETH